MQQWIPQNDLFSLYFTFWLERQITNRILKMMINKMENKQAKKTESKGEELWLFTQSCPTLCDPMSCSMPGSSVLHCLLEFAQIHAHWVKEKERDVANLNRIEHKQTWRWCVWVEWRKGELLLLNQDFWRERKANAKAWRQECAWCTLGTGRRLLELI